MENPAINYSVNRKPFVDFSGTRSTEGCAVILDKQDANTESIHNQADGNTDVLPPGYEKFHFPTPPLYEKTESWQSAGSLLVLFIAAFTSAIWSMGYPWWTVTPLWLLTLGAFIGGIYETLLILKRQYYQLFAPPYGKPIQGLRGLIFVSVIIFLILALSMLAFTTCDSLAPIVLVCGVPAGMLAVCFLFRAPTLSIGLILGGTIVVLALIGFLSPNLSWDGKVLMLMTVCIFFVSPFAGSETPKASVLFHVLGAIATICFAMTVLRSDAIVSGVPVSVPVAWYLLGIAVGGCAAFIIIPLTWNRLRSSLVNAIWPLWYLIIAGGLNIPRPIRLSVLYKGREQDHKPLPLLPYYVAHPRRLTHAISVPCLDDALTIKVQQFGFLIGLVKFVFALASVLDRILPFAKIKVSIKSKPRMDPWSDGTEYWPHWLLREITLPRLGKFRIESGVQGPGLQPIPERAVEDFKRGQLIAFLVEYGVAGPFISAEQSASGTQFRLDFSFLEDYETKVDYEPYGGHAILKIDPETRSLKLIKVRAPHSSTELDVNPLDAVFRRAEAMILASIYFYVVSGKHLVEIHMGLNLIEVALYNAFDARGHFNHPIRMSLYPHLFAHELAEELTTQHLLEDGSTFPQIFATTNAALSTHLNDRFSEYVLHQDEDFEARRRVLLTGQPSASLPEILPQCSLNWELKYAAIWEEYAQALVDAAYLSDEEVVTDESIHILFANLSRSYRKPLPDRFAKLQTKAGLVRFIADTLHHLIIRHEVYGTSAVRLALDPRINKVQVPVDGGPYPIDEWRSLACIAMATSRVRYVKLLDDYRELFEDLNDPGIKAKFCVAHDQMKERLKQLEEAFIQDGIDNYATMRLLPSELEVGAGY